MILGIGTDICEISRIKEMVNKTGFKIVEKHFSSNEQTHFQNLDDDNKINYIAKRFAAKEAIAKALGTGIRNNIHLKDLSITNDELGKPIVTLSNGAREFLEKQTPRLYESKIHISLSDDGNNAIAFVIIEATEK